MYERFSASNAAEAGQIIDADFVPVEEAAAPVSDAAAESASPAAGAAPAGSSALTELWQSIRDRFRLSELSIDDLLLIGIVILILRRNAEWDVLLIMAVLFFLGMFDTTT